MHDESSTRRKVDDNVREGALPAYLLDRDETTRAKVLSNTIKQKHKEKAEKWDVPLPKRRACLVERAHGSYSQRLSFESSTSSDTTHSFASQAVNYYSYNAPDEMPKILAQFLEKKMFPSIGRDDRRRPLKDGDGLTMRIRLWQFGVC